MGGEWRTAVLGDLTVNHDGKRKPVKESDRRPGPYPYYGASGIVDYVDGYLLDGDYLLIAEDGENLRTRQTPIAFMARGKSWVNNHAHIVTGNEDADTRFLMYAIEGTDISGYLTGAVMPKMTQGNLNKIELNCPPLPEQRAIAHILGTLDDKIELLRRQNETLEAMARALFKAWFVDFELVRAKMDGRWQRGESLPGMPAELWELFPDRLVESELGEIPEGWRVLPFLQACDLIGGAQPPASTFIDEPREGYVRLLQIRDFASDSHITYVPKSKKLKCADEDDVLIGRYGSASGNKVRDSLGRVCRGLSGAYNVALMKLSPIEVGREFALQLVNAPSFYNYLQGVSAKAVQSGFSKSELGNLSVAIPPRSLADIYEATGLVFWQRVKVNRTQVRSLESLRDTLLPKLISGELRVPSAAQQLEEMT